MGLSVRVAGATLAACGDGGGTAGQAVRSLAELHGVSMGPSVLIDGGALVVARRRRARV